MYLLALGAVALASAFDLRSREIPNWISVALLVVSLSVLTLGRHPAGAYGVLWGMVAAASGAIALFALKALGGGDVKLLIALGATLGIGAFLPFALAMTIAGGLLAVRAKMRGEREIAYAPAMLLGLLALAPLTWIAR